jgi:hypothetical protein
MIIGISMVRDEADIIGTTVAHLIAEGVDQFLILDNGSVDGTREILEQFPQVTLINDPVVAYMQSEKMTMLAEDARCLGAEWVLPFDADEIVYARKGTIAETVTGFRGNVLMIEAYEHPPCAPPLSPYRALAPKQKLKVAFRAAPDVWIAQGSHAVAHPAGKRRVAGLLALREFQYRTFEQFARKVRNGKQAYDATDLPYSEGAHWRLYGAMSDDDLAIEWAAMTTRADIVHDPAPIRC